MRRLPPWLSLLSALVALLLVTAPRLAAQVGGLQSYYLLAAVGTNATVVTGCRPTNLYTAELISIGATNIFLKLYNQCTAPASTDTPVRVIAAHVGLQTTGLSLAHALFNPAAPMRFSTGLSYRLTTGIANANDDGVPGSTAIVQFTYTSS